jgi:hypothetical protein
MGGLPPIGRARLFPAPSSPRVAGNFTPEAPPPPDDSADFGESPRNSRIPDTGKFSNAEGFSLSFVKMSSRGNILKFL